MFRRDIIFHSRYLYRRKITRRIDLSYLETEQTPPERVRRKIRKIIFSRIFNIGLRNCENTGYNKTLQKCLYSLLKKFWSSLTADIPKAVSVCGYADMGKVWICGYGVSICGYADMKRGAQSQVWMWIWNVDMKKGPPTWTEAAIVDMKKRPPKPTKSEIADMKNNLLRCDNPQSRCTRFWNGLYA